MLRRLYHFLSPKFQTVSLDYPVDMRPRYGHGLAAHPELYACINAERGRYELAIDKALSLREHLWKIEPSGQKVANQDPAWNNGFLPGLDMAMIYTLLVQYQPKRYVEVGSGNSTKVAHRAIRDHALPTRITSIDPHPRAEIDALADEVIRRPFESLDLTTLTNLEPGDILFIDNSHRILPNSDATVFFLEVLPKLKKGVIVHIHDIYLPYDYPQFMCDRAYSEQYGLAFFLLANSQRYRPLVANYFISEDEPLRQRCQPLWQHPNLAGVEQHGGSFWLEIDAV